MLKNITLSIVSKEFIFLSKSAANIEIIFCNSSLSVKNFSAEVHFVTTSVVSKNNKQIMKVVKGSKILKDLREDGWVLEAQRG
jgi:hypothetical protein